MCWCRIYVPPRRLWVGGRLWCYVKASSCYRVGLFSMQSLIKLYCNNNKGWNSSVPSHHHHHQNYRQGWRCVCRTHHAALRLRCDTTIKSKVVTWCGFNIGNRQKFSIGAYVRTAPIQTTRPLHQKDVSVSLIGECFHFFLFGAVLMPVNGGIGRRNILLTEMEIVAL